MACHIEHLATKFRYDECPIFRLPVFQNELNDVVLWKERIRWFRKDGHFSMATYPVLILHQIDRVLVKLVKQRASLVFGQILKAPLQYSATIWVCRKLIHAAAERCHECEPLGSNSFNEFLDHLSGSEWSAKNNTDPLITHMVAICVLDTSQNASIQFLHKRTLLFWGDVLDSL